MSRSRPRACHNGRAEARVSRMRRTAANRALGLQSGAAAEAGAQEQPARAKRRKDRRRKRRAGRHTDGGSTDQAPCDARRGKCGRGNAPAAAAAVTALHEAAGDGSAALVRVLRSLIRDKSLWNHQHGTAAPYVEEVIAHHYNELPESAQFELLLARMQHQQAEGDGGTGHGACDAAA